MALIPADPSLSEAERKSWEAAQTKIKLSKNPPLKTVLTTAGVSGIQGDLKRVEQTTPAKAPVAQK